MIGNTSFVDIDDLKQQFLDARKRWQEARYQADQADQAVPDWPEITSPLTASQRAALEAFWAREKEMMRASKKLAEAYIAQQANRPA